MGPRLVSAEDMNIELLKRLQADASMGPRLVSAEDAGRFLFFVLASTVLQWGRAWLARKTPKPHLISP